MDKIDKYLNSIYRGVDNSSKETEDLKQEMRSHLMQTVRDLQESGVTEEESIRIAIDRFGEGFQIRSELNQVLKFQKVFARKTLIASLILLGISIILVITSLFVHQGFFKRCTTLDSQINLVEKALVNEGITGVDRYAKELFENEKNNQLTYIAIKELPANFEYTSRTRVFPGEIKYSYPEKVKEEYYSNTEGKEVSFNNIRYILETGVKTSANRDNSSIYVALAILAFIICCVLLIIWYFMYSNSTNSSNVVSNRRKSIIYISIFCSLVLLSILYYVYREPYRIRRFYDLIFN